MNFFLQVSLPNPCLHVSSMSYTLSHRPWFICSKIQGNLSCTFLESSWILCAFFICPVKTSRRTMLYFSVICICCYYPVPLLYVPLSGFIFCCCCENCTLLDCNIGEGIVIFHCILSLCWRSSTFVEEHVFPHGKVALLPFQPLVHSIPHYLVIGVFLQAFVRGTRQVLMWWCEVRAVGWTWQHCHWKVYNGLRCACFCVTKLCPGGSNSLRHFSCGTNSWSQTFRLVTVSVQC